MGALPRAYSNPDGLITDDTCLVIMSDASDIGVGSALWHVKRADASKVTIEDLQDHTISTIIAIDAKVLSQSEQHWFTFEQEISCKSFLFITIRAGDIRYVQGDKEMGRPTDTGDTRVSEGWSSKNIYKAGQHDSD